MKISIENISKTKLKIEVEVEKEKFNDYFDIALKELAKQIEIDGFRKGMVPVEVAQKYINPSNILMEAAQIAVSDAWPQVIKEKKIEAVEQPKIEIKKIAKDNPFVFNAEVEILSDIELPDYKEIAKKLELKEIEVSEKEIKDAISYLQRSRAKLTPKEDGCVEGDLVSVKYISEDITGGREKEDKFILGKGHFLEGFEDNILGMKAGEEKDFTLKLKKEKKEIKVKLKMESVKKMDLPELTDEWVKSLGKFDKVEDLKKNIAEGLKEEKDIAQKNKRREDFLEKVAKKSKIEVPECLLEKESQRMMENVKAQISQGLKMEFGEYLKKIKKDETEFIKDNQKMAEKRIKNYLILKTISEKEKIEVSDKEVEERINQTLSQYPNPEEAKKQINLDQARFYIIDELKRENTFKILGL